MTICSDSSDVTDWLRFRATQRRLHGAALPDDLVVTWVCRECGEETVEIAHRPCKSVSYRDLDGLITAAVEASLAAAARPAPCTVCGGDRAIDQADYHVSHSAAACDFVVRWRPRGALFGRGRTELFWWDPDLGYQRTERLSEEEIAAVERDALVRALRSAHETGGLAAALPILEEAVARIPDERALTDYIAPLREAGHAATARAIAGARVEAGDADPVALYWLGALIMEDVAHGVWPLEMLTDAERHLDRALVLRPDYPEAELARARAARLRGDNALAVRMLRALCERHPDYAEAAHDLGVLLLVNDPAAALEAFRRGLDASPRDAACARGVAEALLCLGRIDEARAAIAHARFLAPHDPRVEAIAAALRRD